MQDEAHAEQIFVELKRIGVLLAIDDFGTGYSSFSRLRELSVDRLKIDRSFINRINSNTDDRTLVAAMIKMAHTLGLDEKCDHAQGYLHSKPLTVTDARVFLKRLAEGQETSRTLRLRKITQ